MKGITKRSMSVCALLMSSALVAPHVAYAQETAAPAEAGPARERASMVSASDIIVTATKRAGGVSVQDAPVAITAFDEALIKNLHLAQINDVAL